MSKSELKRLCVMNPLEMAERIVELEQKLVATSAELDEAEMRLRNMGAALAKERQAKELSERLADLAQFQRHVAAGTSRIGPVPSEAQALLMDFVHNLERVIRQANGGIEGG